MSSTKTISVTLITQGEHRFYSGTMEIEVIASSCSTNPRASHPEEGFQRTLDENRANAIAEYIRSGGTIPSSIILSAQPQAEMSYSSKKRSITFTIDSSAFLILDGQHRVYGFKKLLNEGVKYRIPVIVYNDLSPIQEARLFIDINTLQKPVPKELLLDIKRLADRETESEKLLDELFSDFENEADSYLLNKLSRIDKKPGKISKVTFYDSMKAIVKEFEIENVDKLYQIMNAYFHAAGDLYKENGLNLSKIIAKATVFKILVSHSKSVISMIFDYNPENIEKISEYKKYLSRSLPGSFDDISASRAYARTTEALDRKLLKRTVRI
ncbi:DGQHR domain-containing protein [Hahella sp. HN01]|uniref:DGQHR domain-containing protein n=1 Tax=Hahella sp. HN01 TaxID=2847262 RepID=UPI001C1EF128|nr:DGQHR domain-containing protein [Hahella sp. HN01]MBU6952616.1 DGQHR domain-containing protein [Hahella sp. HN01]